MHNNIFGKLNAQKTLKISTKLSNIRYLKVFVMYFCLASVKHSSGVAVSRARVTKHK
jgi:hypothetical protein